MSTSKNSFHKWGLFFLLAFSGCAVSHDDQASPGEIDDSVPISVGLGTRDALGNPAVPPSPAGNSPISRPSKGTSAINGASSTSVAVATNTEQSKQQANVSTSTVVGNTPPTTEPPRFSSFGCTVIARDFSNPAPTGSRALEILVQTNGPTSGGVWLETTSRDFRRRSAIALDTKGVGRTVQFVPDGNTAQVDVYASSTFEPSAMMCRTSN